MSSGKGFPKSGPRIGRATVTSTELANLLGISRQRVNELGRHGKITREPDGKWDPAKVAVELGRNLDGRQASPTRAQGAGRKIGHHRQPGEDGEAPKKGTLLYEQWRHTREKADREAIERKALEGSVLKREEVKTAVSTMLSRFKNRLLPIADELCDKLAAASDPIRCREMVDGKIHQALSELAEYPARA